jgi:hypothetical protein
MEFRETVANGKLFSESTYAWLPAKGLINQMLYDRDVGRA